MNRIIGLIILISTGLSVLSILVLHFLQPDKDPSVNAISEFVLGSYGIIMTVTFFMLSIGSVAVGVFAFKIGKRKAAISGILFFIAALGSVIAGIFPTDPILQDTPTSAGQIHSAGGLIRFLSLAIALPLLSSSLNKNQKALTVLAYLFLLFFLGTILVLVQMNLFGLGQRLFIGTMLVWMLVFSLPVVTGDSREEGQRN